jgi:hypothetical protein
LSDGINLRSSSVFSVTVPELRALRRAASSGLTTSLKNG